MENTGTKRVLLICYSMSGQTSSLRLRLTAGLEEGGVSVTTERLTPINPIRFPLGSIPATISKMVTTFFRQKTSIEPLSKASRQQHDLIILAGPTWSYNPSGPILSLIQRDGAAIFNNQVVIPLISCRGYWRMHWFGLAHLLRKCGATVGKPMVFAHPSKEPWRTIGVFLKLAGHLPEKSRFIGRHYPRYGHINQQHDEAQRLGLLIAQALTSGADLTSLDLRSAIATP